MSSLLVSPRRLSHKTNGIIPKPLSSHSTGQTLLKVYSEELPKLASRISVYSEPTKEKKRPEQIRSSKVDRCLNLCYPTSRS